MTEITGLTRRDRLRAATMEEITTTARRLLVEQGPDAASLRAIAREMGMTAPGLYRYYSSREELLRHVVASMFRELAGDIRGAIEAAGPKHSCVSWQTMNRVDAASFIALLWRVAPGELSTSATSHGSRTCGQCHSMSSKSPQSSNRCVVDP